MVATRRAGRWSILIPAREGWKDVSFEVRWGAHTDTGRRRSRNEDAYLAKPPVFAVADGMGGHSRGDLAAAMAVEALAGLSSLLGEAPGVPRALVLDTIRAVDRAIHDASSDPADGGMGTTLCGLVTSLDEPAPTALVFNVGDSRVYRSHAGHLVQISKDHSVVQELVDAGEIDAAGASTHPERNVVTRSLGSGDPLDIDWWTLPIETQDRWLLCSDGLVKEISEADISHLLSAAPTAQVAAEDLVAAALAGGGRDNITVVVVEILGTAPATDPALDADTNPRQLSSATKPRPRPGPTPDEGPDSNGALRRP